MNCPVESLDGSACRSRPDTQENLCKVSAWVELIVPELVHFLDFFSTAFNHLPLPGKSACRAINPTVSRSRSKNGCHSWETPSLTQCCDESLHSCNYYTPNFEYVTRRFLRYGSRTGAWIATSTLKLLCACSRILFAVVDPDLHDHSEATDIFLPHWFRGTVVIRGTRALVSPMPHAGSLPLDLRIHPRRRSLMTTISAPRASRCVMFAGGLMVTILVLFSGVVQAGEVTTGRRRRGNRSRPRTG